MFHRNFRFILRVLGVAWLVWAGCVKSTDPYEDGRVFIYFDMDPSTVGARVNWTDASVTPRVDYPGHFWIGYQIEGEEPVERLTSWEEQPVEFDLIGAIVPGGIEITVWAKENQRFTIQQTFRMDGNAHLRIRFVNPNDGRSDWLMERLI